MWRIVAPKDGRDSRPSRHRGHLQKAPEQSRDANLLGQHSAHPASSTAGTVCCLPRAPVASCTALVRVVCILQLSHASDDSTPLLPHTAVLRCGLRPLKGASHCRTCCGDLCAPVWVPVCGTLVWNIWALEFVGLGPSRVGREARASLARTGKGEMGEGECIAAVLGVQVAAVVLVTRRMAMLRRCAR